MSSAPQIRFIWPEKNIDNLTNILYFQSTYKNIIKKDFFNATIEPSLLDELNQPIGLIHFFDIQFDHGELIFRSPYYITLKAKGFDIITVTVIDPPKPCPNLVSSNPRLVNLEDNCYGHVFYHDHHKEKILDNLTYLDSFCLPWNQINSRIISKLKENKLGEYGISVGFVDMENKFPTLLPIQKQFMNLDISKKAMIIIVTSFKDFTLTIGRKVCSSESLPEVPRKMAHFISNFGDAGLRYSAVRRRILTCIFNGGIPVSLFDKEEIIKIPSSNDFLVSSNIDQYYLSLCVKTGEAINFDQIFNHELRYLKNMNTETNESSLRSFFWDIVIMRFMSELNDDEKFKFELISEWRTSSLFPQMEKRIIDLAALIKIGGQSFPLLQIELGTDVFDSANPPKDLSKMLGTMSKTLIELAHTMSQNGKRPEDARVYGIWIGGTCFQLCVAHPIISRSSEGKFEIYSHLTFKDEWIFDVLYETPLDINDFPIAEPFESIIQGNVNLNEFIESENIIQRDIVLAGEKKDEDDIPYTAHYSGLLNIRTLTILRNFLKIVHFRIDLICNSKASEVEKKREYRPKGNFGNFVESRSGSTQQTPSQHKTKQAFAGGKMSKTSMLELKYLLELSKFPQIFPRMYKFQIEDDGSITYEFEKLEVLRDEYGYISDLIDNEENNLEVLRNCIFFGIQTLYGLYVLHESLNIVHSDISPNNVMFSSLDHTWKLNDYDQSLKVDESLILKRTAGTKKFTAPESEISGIFSKESDIYSLGQVMMHCVNPVILERIFCINVFDEDIQPDPELIPFGRKLINIMHSMTSNDPRKRPNAYSALSQFLDIFHDFANFVEFTSKNEILREAQMCIKLQNLKLDEESKELNVQDIELKSKYESLTVQERIQKFESELKKPKLSSTEKDQITSELLLPGPE